MPRWLRWLTYSHDPEAHGRLAAIEQRLDVLLKATPAAKPAPVPRRHDCGHEDASYSTDGNGTTRCRACQDKWLRARTRDKAPLT